MLYALGGARSCTPGVSPPSQSGCLAVESKCDEVLKSSYLPAIATSFVLARSCTISSRFIGLRFEGFCCLEGLVENLWLVDAGDHGRGGETQRVVQALHGSDRLAFQNDAVAHGFHAQDADVLFDQFGQNHLRETAEVGVVSKWKPWSEAIFSI